MNPKFIITVYILGNREFRFEAISYTIHYDGAMIKITDINNKVKTVVRFPYIIEELWWKNKYIIKNEIDIYTSLNCWKDLGYPDIMTKEMVLNLNKGK